MPKLSVKKKAMRRRQAATRAKHRRRRKNSVTTRLAGGGTEQEEENFEQSMMRRETDGRETDDEDKLIIIRDNNETFRQDYREAFDDVFLPLPSLPITISLEDRLILHNFERVSMEISLSYHELKTRLNTSSSSTIGSKKRKIEEEDPIKKAVASVFDKAMYLSVDNNYTITVRDSQRSICLNVYISFEKQDVFVNSLSRCGIGSGTVLLNKLKELANIFKLKTVTIGLDVSKLRFIKQCGGEEKHFSFCLSTIGILASGKSFYNHCGFYEMSKVIQTAHDNYNERLIGGNFLNFFHCCLRMQLNAEIMTIEEEQAYNSEKGLKIKEKVDIFLHTFDIFLKHTIINVHVSTSEFFTTLQTFVFAVRKQEGDIDDDTCTKCEIYEEIVNLAYYYQIYAYNRNQLVWKNPDSP